MKLLVLMVAAAGVASGALIVTDPVGLTGSGNFSASVFDHFLGLSFRVFGTNSSGDSVGITIADQESAFGGNLNGSLSSLSATTSPIIEGIASINSISSTNFSYSFGAGHGSLSLLDGPRGTVIASAALQAYIIPNVTSSQGGESNGTFTIVSNPEPSAAWLLLVGCPIIWWTRRRAQRAPSRR